MEQPIPQTYSAAKDQTVVHKGSKELTTSRLNARDLVANVDGWEWGPAPESAAPAEVEAEAPPVADMEPEPSVDEESADVVKPGSQSTIVDTDTLRAAEAGGTEPAAPADVNAMHLTDAAKTVVGSDDLQSYLDGFPVPTLRELSKTKFGHTIHHRATKATAVAKLIELEGARILATADD